MNLVILFYSCIIFRQGEKMENTCFKRLILLYMNRNLDFNYLIDSLKKTYGINYLSNDIMNYINDNIFSNQEFIKVIYKECPSLFERIYKTILSLKDNLVTKDLLIDVKLMWNKVAQVWSKIKVTKGNIPIDLNLLNKYKNFEEIFTYESNNYNDNIKIWNTSIKELEEIDINTLTSNNTKNLAKKIFKNYNLKNIFNNKNNFILVSNNGIEESINKIFNSSKQRNLLKEHLLVFSELGNIINHIKLVSQSNENKNRDEIFYWNYYFDNLEINGIKYSLEIEVRSMHDGTNQYRVQRLEKNQYLNSEHQ